MVLGDIHERVVVQPKGSGPQVKNNLLHKILTMKTKQNKNNTTKLFYFLVVEIYEAW